MKESTCAKSAGKFLYMVRHSKVNKVIWLKSIEKIDILNFFHNFYEAEGMEFGYLFIFPKLNGTL